MIKIAVADADALIALSLETDPHYKKAVDISKRLEEQGYSVIFPITAFPEAITTLKRAFNQPQKAHIISKKLQQGDFQVEYLNGEIIGLACQIFDQAKSKQNTFFDAIVAAVAKKLGTDIIFSFDNWYPKLGFKLV